MLLVKVEVEVKKRREEERAARGGMRRVAKKVARVRARTPRAVKKADKQGCVRFSIAGKSMCTSAVARRTPAPNKDPHFSTTIPGPCPHLLAKSGNVTPAQEAIITTNTALTLASRGGRLSEGLLLTVEAVKYTDTQRVDQRV